MYTPKKMGNLILKLTNLKRI